MISKSQYEVLLHYREGPIPVPSAGLLTTDMELLEMRLVEPASFSNSIQGIVHVIATPLSYQITEKGQAALDEYKNHQQERAAQKRKQFLRDLTIAACGSALGAMIALVIEHLVF